jgi:hypothetical protein
MTLAKPDTIPPQGYAPMCIWRDGPASIWTMDTGGLLLADSSDLSHMTLEPSDAGHLRDMLALGECVQREWAGAMDAATIDTRALYALLVGEPWDVIGWTEAEACENLQRELTGTDDPHRGETTMSDKLYEIRSWNNTAPETVVGFDPAKERAQERAAHEGRLVKLAYPPTDEEIEVAPDGTLGKHWHCRTPIED